MTTPDAPDSLHPVVAPEIDLSIPGMRIKTGGVGDPWPLVIRTAAPQGWKAAPQTDADLVSLIVHPTTILYRDQYYQVIEAEVTPAGWVYRLRPLPDGETQLHVIELTREQVLAAAAEKKQFDKIQRLSYISATYEILLGWLPARWQEWLSQFLHFSPPDATRKNGLLFFLVGIGAIMPVLRIFGTAAGILMFVCAFDGAWRWFTGLAAEKAMGFAPLELVERLVHGAIALLLGALRRLAGVKKPGR